jgi:hypothetical protein
MVAGPSGSAIACLIAAMTATRMVVRLAGLVSARPVAVGEDRVMHLVACLDRLILTGHGWSGC